MLVENYSNSRSLLSHKTVEAIFSDLRVEQYLTHFFATVLTSFSRSLRDFGVSISIPLAELLPRFDLLHRLLDSY